MTLMHPAVQRAFDERIERLEQNAMGRERLRIVQLIASMAQTTDEIAFAAELVEAIATPEAGAETPRSGSAVGTASAPASPAAVAFNEGPAGAGTG